MRSSPVRTLASGALVLSLAGALGARAALASPAGHVDAAWVSSSHAATAARPVRTADPAQPVPAPATEAPTGASRGLGDGRAHTYDDPRRGDQWALDALGAEELHARRTADGVVVAVIDSGVQGDHPDLRGRLVPGYDFVTDRPGGTRDGYGHGTHVAAIVAAPADDGVGVAGMAPEARVMPLRVLDDHGAGWGSDVARALVYAADHGAKVANVSMASDYSRPVADAVRYARSRGVIVVAAVGNDRGSGDAARYPAALPGVIGVGAVDERSRVAVFSESGPEVDVVAPGVSVLSAYAGSRREWMSGTSMAAPFVAATVAVMAAGRPGLTDAEARGALVGTARDVGARGVDGRSGAGLVRPLAAVCRVVGCAGHRFGANAQDSLRR